MLEIRLRFSLYFPKPLPIYFLYYFVYLFRFITNNRRHFQTYMLTRVSNFTFLYFNPSMFTKEDGTTISNEDRK